MERIFNYTFSAKEVPPPLHINRTVAVICVKIPIDNNGIFCILISYIFKNDDEKF